MFCFRQAMVSCHMLSELEEVIQYKLVPERREIIRQIWWERLQVSWRQPQACGALAPSPLFCCALLCHLSQAEPSKAYHLSCGSEGMTG